MEHHPPEAKASFIKCTLGLSFGVVLKVLARCWPIVVKFMLLKCVFGRSAFPPLEFGLHGELFRLVHVLIVLDAQVILCATLLMSTEFMHTLYKAKG